MKNLWLLILVCLLVPASCGQEINSKTGSNLEDLFGLQACNDGDPCTDDVYSSGTCVYSNNTAQCDDGDSCTENDVCSHGTCAGEPLDGDEDGFVSNSCGGTDCDDMDGAVNPGITEGSYGDLMCNDEADNDCDGLTDISDNGCQECTSAADCNDGNPCTDDDCSESSCVYSNNADQCDDGDSCTENDVCSDGTCAGELVDGDGDGYAGESCGGNDCDDEDGTVNPGEAEGPVGNETCSDRVDNDCDEYVDGQDSGCSDAAPVIADHTVAKESVLRSIPESAISAAKDNLHIMYCGTSHSSQTTGGMNNLQSYKPGDDSLFAVTFNGNPVAGALDIDYRPTSPVNVYSASDLSHDSTDGEGHTGYYHRTIEYLDHQDHADINVVMWSWCSIEGHDVEIYLDNFAQLIDLYRAGGSKGRTAASAVTFVFMSGYARGSHGDTPEPPYLRSPYQNHKRIVDFCRANGYFCLDYWSHDTHDYGTDAYYPTALGNSPTHLLDWMNAHPGEWYQCNPAHAAAYDLLGNRRAYAAWWLWARIAGWSGN